MSWWTEALALIINAIVCSAIFNRWRRREIAPLDARIVELESRLANALPEGDPYRSKVLPMLGTTRGHVYCMDCRFKGYSGSSGRDVCLGQPDKGLYPLLGDLNKNHDCDHFQKRERT